MAKIPDGSFTDWNNGQTINATDYEQDREMLRTAVNDNHDRVVTLEEQSDYLRLNDNFAIPADGPVKYPVGISLFRSVASTDWGSVADADVFVQTNKSEDGEATQIITSVGATPRLRFRHTDLGVWQPIQELETVARNDEKLSVVQKKKITADDGNVNIVFTESDNILSRFGQFGLGLRTFYAPTGATGLPPSGISCRGLVHFTNSDIGWVWAIDYRNNVWTNYYNGTAEGWKGWTELSSTEIKTLYSGWSLPMGGTTITPSKKLSECKNGWILVWSDFDGPSTPKDYDFVYSFVPKAFIAKGIGGASYFAVPNYMSGTTTSIAVKKLFIYDDKFTGSDDNDKGDSNDVVIRYVFEF